MEALTKRAEGGCVNSIRQLGLLYRHGNDNGMEINHQRALYWFKHGSRHDDPVCVARLALLYMKGIGTTWQPTQGLMLMMRAATLGSEHACAFLGEGYAFGKYTMPKDEAEASHWFRKVVACSTCRDSTSATRSMVGKWLYEHDREWFMGSEIPRFFFND